MAKKTKKYKNTIMDENIPGVDIFETQKRLPSILLVDCSGSMQNNKSAIEASVQAVYTEILADPVASRAVELGIMSFNETIKILVNIQEIYKQTDRGENLNFVCEKQTLTGFAVQEALYQLESRVQMYIDSKSGIRSYAPILFIISDGAPACYNLEVKREEEKAREEVYVKIKNLVSQNKLNVICFEIGNLCNHEVMQKLTGTDDPKRVIHLNSGEESAREVSKAFKITSSLLISQSNNENLNAELTREDNNNNNFQRNEINQNNGRNRRNRRRKNNNYEQ